MLDNISGVSKNHIYATLQQFAAATSFPHLSISEMLLSYLNWPQHDWTAYHLQRWRGETARDSRRFGGRGRERETGRARM